MKDEESGLPCGSDCKETAGNGGDRGSIPGSEDPLKKGVATHSSILAWRIPWTEEPGGLAESPWDHKELDTPATNTFFIKLLKVKLQVTLQEVCPCFFFPLVVLGLRC